jgi:hypothetical protein
MPSISSKSVSSIFLLRSMFDHHTDLLGPLQASVE